LERDPEVDEYSFLSHSILLSLHVPCKDKERLSTSPLQIIGRDYKGERRPLQYKEGVYNVACDKKEHAPAFKAAFYCFPSANYRQRLQG
jgi:hypothetical protein